MGHSNTGRKDDKGKLRIDLIPHEVITALSTVLQYGAAKYGERNFERGLDMSRAFASAQRHLWSWWKREELDESGYKHLWHALAALAVLIVLDARFSNKHDDRPKQ